MDKQELQQKIAEFYAKLPSNAQEYFAKMEWLEKLTNYANSYGLDQEQVQTLYTETMLVLLGIIHLEEYENTVLNGLGIPKEISYKLLVDIDKNILLDLRDNLTETFIKNTSEEILPEEENPISPNTETKKEEEEMIENISFIISGGKK